MEQGPEKIALVPANKGLCLADRKTHLRSVHRQLPCKTDVSEADLQKPSDSCPSPQASLETLHVRLSIMPCQQRRETLEQKHVAFYKWIDSWHQRNMKLELVVSTTRRKTEEECTEQLLRPCWRDTSTAPKKPDEAQRVLGEPAACWGTWQFNLQSTGIGSRMTGSQPEL